MNTFLISLVLLVVSIVVATFVITYVTLKIRELFDILVTIKHLPGQLNTIHKKLEALADMTDDLEANTMQQFDILFKAIDPWLHNIEQDIKATKTHAEFIAKEINLQRNTEA